MFRWLPYTFIRIVAFFMGGILAGIYLAGFIPTAYVVALLAILTILYYFLFSFQKYSIASVINPGYVALPIIFVCGYLHVLFKTEIKHDNHFANALPGMDAYKVVITGYNEEKDHYWKTEGRITEVYNGKWSSAEGKLQLYFSKSDFGSPYHYGNVLLVKGAPQPVPAPANPEEFDYKQFLAVKNIYHQHFVDNTQVMLVDNDPPYTTLGYAIAIRHWAQGVLEKVIEGRQEQGLASALVLGVTDGLDHELLGAYAATGTMHVLAVSGLHVSIIYFILVFLLKPLKTTPSGKVIIGVVSLFVLWGYAFITGLSPSVLRAVVMFSFVAIGRLLSRDTNIYNTLALSAFCLLVYDPYLILSVGFQLSYLAVLGIVYFQPRIVRLWEPSSWFVDKVWSITSVSLAAQLATFALGLLYFHQFPNYFLLSNLVVIPLSFGVLVLGVAVLSVSFISVIAEGLGFLLTLCIKIMNGAVSFVEMLPFSRIEDIHITPLQCWVLLGLIVCFALMVEYKQYAYLYPAFVLTVVYSYSRWVHHYNQQVNQSAITVYNIPGYSAIDLMQNAQALFLADSALINSPGKVKFHITPNRIYAGVNKIFHVAHSRIVNEVEGARLIVWNGRKILNITRAHFASYNLASSFDLIIISNNSVNTITSLQSWYPHTPVILDSSNSYYYSTKIIEQAKALKADIYSVPHQGAYTFRFDKQS